MGWGRCLCLKKAVQGVGRGRVVRGARRGRRHVGMGREIRRLATRRETRRHNGRDNVPLLLLHLFLAGFGFAGGGLLLGFLLRALTRGWVRRAVAVGF